VQAVEPRSVQVDDARRPGRLRLGNARAHSVVLLRGVPVAELLERADDTRDVLFQGPVDVDELRVGVREHRAPKRSTSREGEEHRARAHERLGGGLRSRRRAEQELGEELTLSSRPLEDGRRVTGAKRHATPGSYTISSRFIIFCKPKREIPSSSAARVWFPSVRRSAIVTSSTSSASSRWRRLSSLTARPSRPATSGLRCSGVTSSSASTRARRTSFSSWRTLPGQAYAASRSMAAFETCTRRPLACRRTKCFTRSGTSPMRSRRLGIRIVITLRR